MATINRKTIIFGGSREGGRNYIPIDNSSLANVSASVSNRIGYFPIYIDKKINNPSFCMQITTAGASNGQLPIGIYDGKNGIDNASLLWSGLLNYGTSTGIYKISPNIMLNEGFYILASCSNVIGGAYTASGPAGVKYTKALFGDSTTSTANSFSTTSNTFESTGINLPLIIDGNISGSYSPITPIITIEY